VCQADILFFSDRTAGPSFVCLSNGLLVYYRIAEIIIVTVIDGKSRYRMDFKKH